MPQLIGSAISNFTGVSKMYPVANGVTVTDGDFVYLASGRVTNASIAGVTLLGIVLGKSTDVSDHSGTLTTVGDAAGTKKVLVHGIAPNDKYVVTSDQIGTTLAASHVGQCFDLTGATGAQLLDSSTVGTTGQLEMVEFGYKGNAAKAVVIVNEHKYKVNA
jgi:hypothetical protein